MKNLEDKLRKRIIENHKNKKMKLRSKYAIRFYNHFKEVREKTRKQTRTLSIVVYSIEELKKQIGIELNKYPYYGDLKKTVIKKAVEEINSKNGVIRLEFQELKKKKGRANKVDKIEFFIYDKEQIPEKKPLPKVFLRKIKKLPLAKYDAYQMLLANNVEETAAFEIVQKIEGTMFVGFEDLFIKEAIKYYKQKIKKRKAPTLTRWCLDGSIDIATIPWYFFAEKVIVAKRKMEAAASFEYDNRILAIKPPHGTAPQIKF